MSCSIDLKIGHNVCLDEVSEELNLGHLGSKTMSLGQIKEISCGCCRGHLSCSIYMKIVQNVCLDTISNKFKLGSPRVNN